MDEVFYTVKTISGNLQFLRNDGQYTVSLISNKPNRWFSSYEMISWALIPSVTAGHAKMDRFILDYFGEGLVTLVALERA